jgi:GTP-binding protein Era
VTGTRSGFIALAGRPNVGKSTLVNAMVGHKIAIVSDKPQTTRRAIRGVSTTGDSQLILVDLPGVQRPRDALTQRMQSRVEREVAENDAVMFVLSGTEGIGPGDRWIAGVLAEAGVPVVIAVNKTDRLKESHLIEVLQAAADLGVGDEIFPVSARTGKGVAPLLDHLRSLLPEGPFLYPPESPSDQPLNVLLAELIREQILRRTRIGQASRPVQACADRPMTGRQGGRGSRRATGESRERHGWSKRFAAPSRVASDSFRRGEKRRAGHPAGPGRGTPARSR